MDTSSSSPPDGFVDFLRRSLEALRAEAPWIFSALCVALAGQRVGIEVDGETVTLAFSRSDCVEVPEPAGAVSVHLGTSSETILGLADARRSLVDAVLLGELTLRGTPRDLVTFDEGLMIYLGGAVRCPSFGGLLHDYRHRERTRSGRAAALGA